MKGKVGIIAIVGLGLGALYFSGALKPKATTEQTTGGGFSGMGSEMNFAGNPYAGDMATSQTEPVTNVYNFPTPDFSQFMQPLTTTKKEETTKQTNSGGSVSALDQLTANVQKTGSTVYVAGQGIGKYDANSGVFVNSQGQGMSVIPTAVKKPTLNNYLGVQDNPLSKYLVKK